MTFGPSMDKSNILGLVRDTAWNGFLELNRLAFSEALPRNSESRALSIALRMIRKHYPHAQRRGSGDRHAPSQVVRP